MVATYDKLDLKKDYKEIVDNYRGNDKNRIRNIFYSLIEDITAVGLAGYFDVGSEQFDKLYRIALYLAIKYQDYANANNIIQSYKKENDKHKRFAIWYYRYVIITYTCRLPRYFIEKPKQLKRKVRRYLKLANNNQRYVHLLTKTLKWHLTYLESILKEERLRDKYKDVFNDFYDCMQAVNVSSDYTKQLSELKNLVNDEIEWEEYINLDSGLILDEVIPVKESYEKTDNIVIIIGDSAVKTNHILGIVKEYGYDKDNVKLYLDYDKLTNLEFRNFQYNDKIDGVIVGPVPHSVKGRGAYSSIIQTITEEEGYPKVIRCQAEGGNLKITKSSLHKAMKELRSFAMVIN